MRWWLNQPIWKNMLVKLGIFPNFRGENSKKKWNHHLEKKKSKFQNAPHRFHQNSCITSSSDHPLWFWNWSLVFLPPGLGRKARQRLGHMSTTLNGKDPSLGPGFFHHGSGGKIYLHIRSIFVYQTASCPLKTQKKHKPTCRLPCNTQVTLPRTNSLRTHGKGTSSCSHLLLVRWVAIQLKGNKTFPSLFTQWVLHQEPGIRTNPRWSWNGGK